MAAEYDSPPESPFTITGDQSEAARHDAPEHNDSHRRSIAAIIAEAEINGGQVLFHGGLPTSATLDDIDLDRPGSQQNKRGRSYGGFYLTDATSLRWAAQYAAERNGNLHGFLVGPDVRILEITSGNTERLSLEERARYAADYDLVKGKDTLGRTQYVLLNKGVVKAVGLDHISNS